MSAQLDLNKLKNSIPYGWSVYENSINGEPYYVNQLTGETQTEIPIYKPEYVKITAEKLHDLEPPLFSVDKSFMCGYCGKYTNYKGKQTELVKGFSFCWNPAPGKWQNYIEGHGVNYLCCENCMNLRSNTKEWKDQLPKWREQKFERCGYCGLYVKHELLLRTQHPTHRLQRVCLDTCYQEVYPSGIDRMDYKTLFKEYKEEREYAPFEKKLDKREILEEIYRRFACDVASGRLSAKKQKKIAKKIKEIIDDKVINSHKSTNIYVRGKYWHKE